MELRGYTNIPDWMLAFDLDVYETIIYAVIYGFSQDGTSTFSGSQKYLAEKAKCSKRKVANALASLIEKQLIKKIDKDVRGIHLCEYYCTTCNTIAPGAGGVARDATNNIEDNIDIDNHNNKRAQFKKPSIQEIAEYCNQRGNAVDPEAFFAYYESNGWMVGRNHMKDWKQAVITWEKSARQRTARQQPRESVMAQNLRNLDALYGTNLYEQNYGKR